VVEGALEVPKDVLRDREMRLTGVVHVHLLDRVGNVGPSEDEVLESPDQAAVGSRVTDRGPHVGGDLGLSVDRRRARLAVPHASMLKDVPSILALVEEEAEALEGRTTRRGRGSARGLDVIAGTPGGHQAPKYLQ
jgi:hypothetical protein